LKNFSWGIAAALVVALLVGAAIGAVVEHERISSESSTQSDPADSMSADEARSVAAEWFGVGNSAACPSLQRWWASTVAAYQTSVQARANWLAARPQLAQQHAENAAALQAAAAGATAAARADLNALIAYERAIGNATNSATTAGSYEASLESLATPESTRAISVLTQAVRSCEGQ
jgi:hypothetical protein